MKIKIYFIILLYLVSCISKTQNENNFLNQDFIKIECIYNDSIVNYYDYLDFYITQINKKNIQNENILETIELKNKIYLPKSEYITLYSFSINKTGKSHYQNSEILKIDSIDFSIYENHFKIIIDNSPHNNEYSPEFLEDYIEEAIYLFIPLKTKDSVEMFSIFY